MRNKAHERAELERASIIETGDGREIAGELLSRLEAMELYMCELLNVMADYEARSAPAMQEGPNSAVPVEFLKWDLLNLVAESRVDAVRLKKLLKQYEVSLVPAGVLLN